MRGAVHSRLCAYQAAASRQWSSGEEHFYLACHLSTAGGAHALRQLGSALGAAADVAAGQEQNISRPRPA